MDIEVYRQYSIAFEDCQTPNSLTFCGMLLFPLYRITSSTESGTKRIRSSQRTSGSFADKRRAGQATAPKVTRTRPAARFDRSEQKKLNKTPPSEAATFRGSIQFVLEKAAACLLHLLAWVSRYSLVLFLESIVRSLKNLHSLLLHILTGY